MKMNAKEIPFPAASQNGILPFSVGDTKAFSPSMRAGGSEHILLLLQLLFLQV
jgi:hypothetical protein